MNDFILSILLLNKLVINVYIHSYDNIKNSKSAMDFDTKLIKNKLFCHARSASAALLEHHNHFRYATAEDKCCTTTQQPQT